MFATIVAIIILKVGVLQTHVTRFLMAGDVAVAITFTRDSETYLDVLATVHYGWWLLAQLWLLKLIGVLSLVSAKAMSATWAIGGLLYALWLLRRAFRTSWLPVLAFTLFFVASQDLHRWSRYGFCSYMASITLGVIVLHALILQYDARLKPRASTALFTLFAFTAGGLFAAPVALLIGPGLVIVWASSMRPREELGIRRGMSRLMTAMWLGLPALLITLLGVLLLPHPQMGRPPDYAAPYLYLSDSGHTGINFLLTRTWMLLQSIFSPGGSTLGAAWTILCALLTACGLLLPWRRGGCPRIRIVGLITLGSLIPAALLALMAWYPYGTIRYEYYATLPIMVLGALGVSELQGILAPTIVRRPIMATSLSITGILLCLVVLVVNTQVLITSRSVTRKINQGYAACSAFLQAHPRIPLILDKYAAERLALARIKPQHEIFRISRGTIRHSKTTDEERTAFIHAIHDVDQVAILTYSRFTSNRYKPYPELLRREGFVPHERITNEWNLWLWERGTHMQQQDTYPAIVDMRGGASLQVQKTPGWAHVHLPPNGRMLLRLKRPLNAGTELSSSLQIRGGTHSVDFAVERHGKGPLDGKRRHLTDSSKSINAEITHFLKHSQSGGRAKITNVGNEPVDIEIQSWVVRAQLEDSNLIEVTACWQQPDSNR